MLLLLFGLVFFLGVHSIRIFAPGWRHAMAARFGSLWQALHGVLSLVSLVVLAYGFDAARTDTPVLWYPPVWTRHLAMTLMLPALICLVASALPAGRIKARLKFPLTVAVKIWALAHLLANGEVSSIVLFGAFLAWAVVLRIALKKGVAWGEVVLPVFSAARYDLIAVIAGLALWALMIFGLHEWLIGVPVLVL